MTNHEIRMAIMYQQGQIGGKLVNEYFRWHPRVYRGELMDQTQHVAFYPKDIDDFTSVHDAIAVCFNKII